MTTREIKIKASLEQEGVLKDIIENSKQVGELEKVLKVLDALNGSNHCNYAITSTESKAFGICKSSLLAGLLSRYKEYVTNQK